MQEMRRAAAQKRKYHKRRKIWRNIVSVMACIVVFCTTYALILPAITMEKETFCGVEAHVHEAACYAQTAAMVCDPAQGEEIPVLHTHDAFCYFEDQLICTLPELTGHVHTEDCYETVVTEAHIHDESCYSITRGQLLCTLAEEESHSHGEGCYVPGENLICEETEREGHAHGDACYEVSSQMTCEIPESEGHTHGAACYAEAQSLTCALAETAGHTHGEGCYTTDSQLTCELDEGEDHTHGETCYTENTVLTCTLAEESAHAHGEGCYTTTNQLICEIAESEGHVHGAECNTETKTLICTLAEDIGHAHTDACYEQVLSCELAETEGHTHSDACYEAISELACGKEEVAEAITETTLVCTLEEIAPHVHNETCVDCTIRNAIVHQHTEECVQISMSEENLICEKEVHEHTLECYSNPEADLESAKDWEKTFSKAELTGVWREDVLTIAKTQLGYAESSRNYIVDENGETKGYTRYGAWYGIPYGDWCAMYASFCLDYAGVEGMPLHCNCPAWINELTAMDLFHSEDTYVPEPGDVIFFDWDADGSSDHVGLVAEVDEETVKTIEGNSGDEVRYQTYDLADSRIMGYGRLPHQVTEEEQAAIDEVIAMIEEMPSADEIDAKIEEFEEAEDYEGEEAWLTEVYQQVGDVYREYYYLGEDLQPYVTNRDKLLELEYIWSVMPLATRTIWLDGTCGGVYSLRGSDNTRVSHNDRNNPTQNPYTLPTTWKSPSQYAYVLNGWYDITHGEYYAPGAEVVITEDTVFYADWKASTYDIGEFNEFVSDTVSTNDFITTQMFDYNQLINMYSLIVSEKRSGQNDPEEWSLTTGTALNGNTSLNYVFRDWDATTKLTWTNDYPDNDSRNTYHEGNGVTIGIVETDIGVSAGDTSKPNVIPDRIGDSILNLLFGEINTQKMGRFYLGEADHLYHYGTDPKNEELYGYYYYDSEYNAASFSQKDERFYVYDYRERTSTAISDLGDPNNPKYTDFLPLNSTTANTNGKTPLEGTLATGETVYSYDSLNSNNETNSSEDMIGTNMWFGLRSDIEFYLPNAPGNTYEQDGETVYGNRGINGKEMIFEFSGDDDVWVYVDGKLLLDLGGIHGVESGLINFSTGEITMAQYTSDSSDANQAVLAQFEERLQALGSGVHKLSIFYLERGDSLSNCRIRFNISPRYQMTIQKEDVLSRELLDGAEFSVYLDKDCTIPAELWDSKAASLSGVAATNVFKIEHGQGSMWGLAAGNTYYIKETKAPNAEGYELPKGLIKLTLNTLGETDYEVISMVDDKDGNAPSAGFLAYGFRVDPETEEAFMIITNGKSVGDTASITVKKVWNGGTDRPSVTAYLLQDGGRIRETVLSANNDWQYTWENLPVYKDDGETLLNYTVEEGVVPGYIGTVTPFTEYTVTTTTWEEVSGFTNGKTYILVSEDGLGAISADLDTTQPAGKQGSYGWADADLALSKQPQTGVTTQWTAATNGSGFHLSNGITYMNSPANGDYINAGEGTGCEYAFNFADGHLTVSKGNTTWYLSDMNSQYKIAFLSRSENAALDFVLYEATTHSETVKVEDGQGFLITNEPADDVTSVRVEKIWTDRDGSTLADAALYQTNSVPVKLLANNAPTGQSGVLNLRGNWTYTFANLPSKDASGNLITYRVVEDWKHDDWKPVYTTGGDAENGYTILINNVYSRKVDIPVEKVWETPDDQRTDLTVGLYKASADNQVVQLITTITLNEANDWKSVVKAEPPAEGESYYIYESTEDYYATYSNQTTIFIDEVSCTVGKVTFDDSDTPATVTVTNQAMHMLPETGGIGTTLYTTGGLLLMMAAVLLLLHKKTPKRRKEDAS